MLRAFLLSIVLASVTSFAPSALAQPATMEFDIPAQPLESALRQMASKHGVQILFLPEDMKGLTTPGLKGRFTPRQAIEELLKGTGLVASFNGQDTIVVKPRADEMRPATPRGAQVEQTAPISSAAEKEQVHKAEQITVTGSNIRGNRSSPSKVDVIDSGEIVRRGVSSIPELLNTIPQNVHSVGAIRTQVLNREQIDNLGAATGVNLRGLGANATLTLINGHRTAPTGIGTFFDASSIPIVAVERLEIVADGASAIYGSDAVAGVVNYVLKNPSDAIETTFRGGFADSSSHHNYEAALLLGRTWSRGGAIVAAEYRENSALNPTDRSFSMNAASPAPLVAPSQSTSVYSRIDQLVGDRLTLGANVLYSDRASKYPDFLGSFTDISKNLLTGTVDAQYALPGSWSIDADISYTRDHTHYHSINSTGTPFLARVTSTGELAKLSASGAVIDTKAGAIRGAFGAEGIRTSLLADFSGQKIVDSSTSQRSGFGELTIPVVGPEQEMTLAKRVTLSAAVRVNDFDTVGRVSTPKFGFIWGMDDQVTFRGTYGRSFRAPSLYEGSKGGMTSFVRNVADPTSSTGTSRLLFLSGTNPSGLQPEKSRNWTIGFDVSPANVRPLKLSGSYFNYDYTDRITGAPATTAQILANPTLYARYLIVNPTVDQVNAFYAASYRVANAAGVPTTPELITRVVDNRFNNVAQTSISGADFNLSYGLTALGGNLGISLGGTYFFNFDNVLVPGGPRIAGVGKIYTPARLRLRADLNYQRGGWYFGLSTDFVGSYVDSFPGMSDRTVDAWAPVNLRVAYDFTDHSWLRGTTVALVVKNLANQDPPSIRDQNPSGQGPYGYDIINADPLKRVVTFEIRHRW